MLVREYRILMENASDFSKLHFRIPKGVFRPSTVEDIIQIIDTASHDNTPLTIRCQGLSQGGQSITSGSGNIVSMLQFKDIIEAEKDMIWVSAANTWEEVLKQTLPNQLAPKALPYNCQLSVSGVLSAGGMGAAAFKYGPMISNVAALEVIDGNGNHSIVDSKDDLFKAVLGGQGNFGIITRACMKLRKVNKNVKTWFLLYDDLSRFFEALTMARAQFDYIESFCSASLQGSMLVSQQRSPLTYWLYGLHVSLEYDQDEPDNEWVSGLNANRILHQQCENIESYFLRHNHRFEAMKQSGLWTMMHPWYECYIDQQTLEQLLAEILFKIPTQIAPFIHIIPIKHEHTGMLMFPKQGPIYSFMILNPGVPHIYKPMVIETINWLNETFMSYGGKRYLSGYQGEHLTREWWQQHFGERLTVWQSYKKRFDPNLLFNSKLFENMPR